jgi:hypothetical protein
VRPGFRLPCRRFAVYSKIDRRKQEYAKSDNLITTFSIQGDKKSSRGRFGSCQFVRIRGSILFCKQPVRSTKPHELTRISFVAMPVVFVEVSLVL